MNQKVAAFSSWDAFRYILNQPQSSFYINSGFQSREENLSHSLSNFNHLEEKLYQPDASSQISIFKAFLIGR